MFMQLILEHGGKFKDLRALENLGILPMSQCALGAPDDRRILNSNLHKEGVCRLQDFLTGQPSSSPSGQWSSKWQSFLQMCPLEIRPKMKELSRNLSEFLPLCSGVCPYRVHGRNGGSICTLFLEDEDDKENLVGSLRQWTNCSGCNKMTMHYWSRSWWRYRSSVINSEAIDLRGIDRHN